jgi:hypothetical protein
MKYFGGRLEKEPDIRAALKRIRGLLFLSPTREQIRNQSQIAFKVQHFVQCIVRRVVATVDGMNLGWNADNMVTAVTMARSLIETVAITHAVVQDVKVAEEEADFIKVDRALTSAMLSSIHPTFAKVAAFAPRRVMKTVERFDREFLSSPTPAVKDAYEFLCEFVHPNGVGLMMLQSEGEYADEISYELSPERREMVYGQLLSFPLSLLVIEIYLLEDLLARLPELIRLAQSDHSS